MSDNKDKDQIDLDRTDELPVLSRPDIVRLREQDSNFSEDPLSDTGEFDTTALQLLQEEPETPPRKTSTENPGMNDVRRLETDLARLSARWGDVESMLNRLERQDSETDELRTALTTAEHSAQTAAASLDDALGRITALESSLAAVSAQHTQLEEAYAEQQEALARARIERDETRSAIAALTKERTEIEARLHALSERAESPIPDEDSLAGRPAESPGTARTVPEADQSPAEAGLEADFSPSEQTGADDEQSAAISGAAEAAVAQAPPATLVCFTDEGDVRYKLDRPVTTIGRDGDCDIRIVTNFVSRVHAAIVCDGAGYLIEDRNSTNGVFVNSAQVSRSALSSGDWITLGETQFLYQEMPDE